MQTQTPFLEEWLRDQSGSGGAAAGGMRASFPSQPTTARAILQSWSDLRDHSNIQNQKLITSLQTLLNSKSTLHVADPQAKLLLSILSSTLSPPPPESKPLLYRLLYIWVRKSARPSPPLLQSAVQTLPNSTTFHPEEALLLGALSAAPGLSDSSKRVCFDRLCRLLGEGSAAIVSSPELVPEVLAGVGYALSQSSHPYFSKLLAFLLGIWGLEGGPPVTIQHGLMVLRLVEWLVMGLIKSRSLEKIESLCREVSVGKLQIPSCNYARFAVVMSSAGTLRAFRRVGGSNRIEPSPELRGMLEGSISAVASWLVSRVGKDYELDDADAESHLLVQCISLGLAQCGPFPFKGAVLRCLCFALLNDIFPLGFLNGRFVDSSDSVLSRLNRVREHLGSVLFKEAGAVSGVLCNQYSLADQESMVIVESHVWNYSQEFYSKLRRAVLALRGRRDELLRELEKMVESVFLMIVVFAAEVNKQKLDPKSSYASKPEVAVRILVAFSCIEYLRRVRWPEYTDVVRRAVLTLQESGSASTSFVGSMPSYDELTNRKGSCFPEGMKYFWSEDQVQTASILFYLRVIPTCISHIPGPIFGNKVAPTMFLYMCHPNAKVSQASHSVFVAFMSSGKESNQGDQMELKEQLVFYYMQRALEAYPEITPYDGMGSGVAALVRHLPAGSPSIFYCINSLVEKATTLFSLAIKQDEDLWKNWEGDADPCKKLLELLLHLVSLVDVQVLPNHLKLLAQLITQLPEEGQKIVLDEMYAKVADSDDVIRKPTLVSWLQSLSYISTRPLSTSNTNSQSTNKISRLEDELDGGALSLKRTHSRL